VSEHERLLFALAAAAAVVVVVAAVVVVVAVRRRRRRRRALGQASQPVPEAAEPSPRGLAEVGASSLELASEAPEVPARPGGRPRTSGTALERLVGPDLGVDEVVEQLSASSPLVVSYSVRVQPGLRLSEAWRAELVTLLVELLRCPERFEEAPEPLLSPQARRANVVLDLHDDELELVVGFDGPIGRGFGDRSTSVPKERSLRLAVASWSGGSSVHYRLPLVSSGAIAADGPSTSAGKLP